MYTYTSPLPVVAIHSTVSGKKDFINTGSQIYQVNNIDLESEGLPETLAQSDGNYLVMQSRQWDSLESSAGVVIVAG